MNKRALIYIILLAAFSLSACTGNSASTADGTGAEVVASSVSTAESDGAEETETALAENEPTSSFEQVETSVSETESSQAVTPESSDAPPTETSQQTSEANLETTESQLTNDDTNDISSPAESSEPKEEVSLPAESSEPEEEASVPDESSEPEESQETSFDINYWISFAQSYATSIGLRLESSATACWDNPITAGAHCIYLERDIKDRLERYSRDSDITDVWVWAEQRTDNSYNLFIGYA